MENNEYQTTPHVKSEYFAQENAKKTETSASSIEEQYFGLPFKERMKIHNKRMKLKIKAQGWFRVSDKNIILTHLLSHLCMDFKK